MQNRRFVFAIVGFYLLSVGALTGMLIEEFRFDGTRSVLLTQLEKDAHIHEGNHVLAWNCREHGPEVP